MLRLLVAEAYAVYELTHRTELRTHCLLCPLFPYLIGERKWFDYIFILIEGKEFILTPGAFFRFFQINIPWVTHKLHSNLDEK